MLKKKYSKKDILVKILDNIVRNNYRISKNIEEENIEFNTIYVFFFDKAQIGLHCEYYDGHHFAINLGIINFYLYE